MDLRTPYGVLLDIDDGEHNPQRWPILRILTWGAFVAWVLLLAFDTSVEWRIVHAFGASFCLVLAIFQGGNDNGDHRRTDQEIRSNPDQRTNASRGSGAVYAAGPSGTIVAGAALSSGPRGSLVAVSLGGFAQQAQNQYFHGIQSIIALRPGQADNEPTPCCERCGLMKMTAPTEHGIICINCYIAAKQPPIENVGIVLGEVEGYRAWRIFNGYLVSMAVDDVWIPGEPMTAKDVDAHNCNGAHAFKTIQQAVDYSSSKGNIAIGRVKLWGQIIEHELGYRAEFSKPIEILMCRWQKIDGSIGNDSEIANRYGIKVGVGCG